MAPSPWSRTPSKNHCLSHVAAAVMAGTRGSIACYFCRPSQLTARKKSSEKKHVCHSPSTGAKSSRRPPRGLPQQTHQHSSNCCICSCRTSSQAEAPKEHRKSSALTHVDTTCSREMQRSRKLTYTASHTTHSPLDMTSMSNLKQARAPHVCQN